MRAGKRKFIQFLGAALAWPAAAGAQRPPAAKRIAVLNPLAETDAEAQRETSAFRDELKRLGWAEGSSARVDYRWGDGDFGRVRALARELVALKPDVILSRTTPGTTALLHETHSIPIVFVVVGDPVGDGLVATLARPGGNVTGFTNVEASLGGKWLELLREIAPRLVRVGALYNPATAPGGGTYYLRLVEKAAVSMGVHVTPVQVRDAGATARAIDALAREPNAGLLVMPDVSNVANRKVIIASVARHRLPSMYPFSTFTLDGGLVSYGVDIPDLYRRGAGYVDRILRGAKPADLPVQGPVKFDLSINLKTARAIGISLPRSLLLRADKVIE